jgi:hypothetical protein
MMAQSQPKTCLLAEYKIVFKIELRDSHNLPSVVLGQIPESFSITHTLRILPRYRVLKMESKDKFVQIKNNRTAVYDSKTDKVYEDGAVFRINRKGVYTLTEETAKFGAYQAKAAVETESKNAWKIWYSKKLDKRVVPDFDVPMLKGGIVAAETSDGRIKLELVSLTKTKNCTCETPVEAVPEKDYKNLLKF